ncbi:MAG: hypothetical protein V7750_09920, partial [Sneathiella sp.]
TSDTLIQKWNLLGQIILINDVPVSQRIVQKFVFLALEDNQGDNPRPIDAASMNIWQRRLDSADRALRHFYILDTLHSYHAKNGAVGANSNDISDNGNIFATNDGTDTPIENRSSDSGDTFWLWVVLGGITAIVALAFVTLLTVLHLQRKKYDTETGPSPEPALSGCCVILIDNLYQNDPSMPRRVSGFKTAEAAQQYAWTRISSSILSFSEAGLSEDDIYRKWQEEGEDAYVEDIKEGFTDSLIGNSIFKNLLADSSGNISLEYMTLTPADNYS